MVANQGARRVRACILGIIPGDVVESAVKQCETTLKSRAEVTPQRIQGLMEKFSEFGVTKAQLEKRIQRHIDAITPAQLINLGKIYNSLKDGMSSPADWFDTEGNKGKADTLKDKLRQTEPEKEAEGYPCPHCSFQATSERGLKKHITQSHPEIKEGEGQTEPQEGDNTGGNTQAPPGQEQSTPEREWTPPPVMLHCQYDGIPGKDRDGMVSVEYCETECGYSNACEVYGKYKANGK